MDLNKALDLNLDSIESINSTIDGAAPDRRVRRLMEKENKEIEIKNN